MARSRSCALVVADRRVGSDREFVGALLDPLPALAAEFGAGAVVADPTAPAERLDGRRPVVVGALPGQPERVAAAPRPAPRPWVTSASQPERPSTVSAAMWPSPRNSRSSDWACHRTRCGSVGHGRWRDRRTAAGPPGCSQATSAAVAGDVGRLDHVVGVDRLGRQATDHAVGGTQPRRQHRLGRHAVPHPVDAPLDEAVVEVEERGDAPPMPAPHPSAPNGTRSSRSSDRRCRAAAYSSRASAAK